MTLDDAVALAALLALRDYFEGRITLSTKTMREVDALLRPFKPLEEPWSSILDLGAAIAALEAEFPATTQAECAAWMPSC